VVVLFVGAKLLGQASESTVVFKIGTFARKEPVFPVMAILYFQIVLKVVPEL
jgi:hypothetical protein